MEYRIMPIGNIWDDGCFCVPQALINKYIKMASEYQLKALLLILSSNGISDSKTLARSLGLTSTDTDELLDFWVEEGVLVRNGEAVVMPEQTVTQKAEPKPQPAPQPEPQTQPEKEIVHIKSLPLPSLSPKDIVTMCNENDELKQLLRNAQEVLGRSLSQAEQEMLLNMVTYYGLPPAVVLTILHYYKSEKAKGKAIGTSYINAMAKNWAQEGICDLQSADEKLKLLEVSDKLWDDIVSLSGLRHRNPTLKQREMVKAWSDEFSMEMIALACDIMKENTDKPTLNYVNKVLQNWSKKGIKTPEDVAQENDKFKKSSSKKGSSSQIESTYDIDEITKKAMFNENYDI